MQALNLGMGDGVIYKGCKVTKMTAKMSQMGPYQSDIANDDKECIIEFKL